MADNHLQKRWQFKGQSRPLFFAQETWKLANEQNHHPEVTFGFGYAEIKITTHDAKGLTEKDFTLAKAIDGIELPAPAPTKQR